MIYTLDWVQREAHLIADYWNGKDEKFIDGSGEVRTEEDVTIATEILDKVAEIESLIKELGI